jgi:hypothetical protein
MKVDTNNREEIRYSGIRDCVSKMYRNEGILAFYKGLTPSLIRGFVSNGLFFLTYETALQFMNKHMSP